MPSGSVHDFVRHDRSDDVAERMRSVISILTLDFDTIYPFHYSPIVQNAKSSLRKFIESKKGEL
jgi:hypothetical protein